MYNKFCNFPSSKVYTIISTVSMSEYVAPFNNRNNTGTQFLTKKPKKHTSE